MGTARVEDDPYALVVVNDRQDYGERHHTDYLEDDTGVVDDGHQLHTVDVQYRDQ